MKKSIIYLIPIFCLFLATCEKKELAPRPFPRLKTLEVSNITDSTAFLSAEILLRGDYEVLEYGFVWSFSNQPEIDQDISITETAPLVEDEFSFQLSNNWSFNQTYYLRAYLKTADFTVYGTEVNFRISREIVRTEITDFYPKEGSWGDTIYIEGANFSQDTTENLAFLERLKLIPLTASDSLLSFQIPPVLNEDGQSPRLRLRVRGQAFSFTSSDFIYKSISIQSFVPEEVTFGDTLRIKVRNCNPHYTEVMVDGELVEPLSISASEIVVIVSKYLSKIDFPVVVKSAGITRVKQLSLRGPKLEYSFRALNYNDTVKIKATDLHPDLERNIFLLENTVFENIAENPDEIWVVIPFTVDAPELTLKIRINGIEFVRRLGSLVIPSLIAPFEQNFSTYPTVITLNGQNLNREKFSMYFFNGTSSFRILFENILSFTSSEIKIRVDNWLPDLLISSKDPFFISYQVGTFPISQVKINYEHQAPWSQLNNNLAALQREGSNRFRVNGKGYFALGEFVPTNQMSNNIWEFDPKNNSWQEIQNFPGAARSDATAIPMNNGFLIGLGNTGSSELPTDFYFYNTLTKTWTQAPEFPGVGRIDAGYFKHDDQYYIGGGSSSSLKFDPLQEIWQLDPSNLTWRLITERAPIALDQPFTLNNKAYFETSGNFFRYNLGPWTDIPKKTSTPRGITIVNNNKVYYGFNNPDGFVSIYDPLTNDFEGPLRMSLPNKEIGEYLFTIDKLSYFSIPNPPLPFNQVWSFDPSLFK
ncbi:MAG: hypothetical protein Sapg2KO_36710 [Saprospiraceae bacterium]